MSSLLLKIFAAGLVVFSIECATPSGVTGSQNAQSRSGRRESVGINAVRGWLGIAQMPDFFTYTAPDGSVIGAQNYFEVRLLSDQSPGELLFAGMGNDDSYSDNIYAVSLGGQFRVRQVTHEEWARAVLVKNAGASISMVEPVPGKPTTMRISDSPVVRYRGKKFARTGESWTGTDALASPDGKWLAVFSHTSEEGKKNGTLPPFIGGNGSGKGMMYVDIYDTATGEKVMSGHAPHQGGQYPGHAFYEALWVENRYLIVPTDVIARGNTYFLGILPN